MRRLLLLVAVLLPVCSFGATPKIAGSPVSRYTIVYSAAAEAEEGSEIAAYINERLGSSLNAVTDETTVKGRQIRVGLGQTPELFAYSVNYKGGALNIDGGGCWALRKAVDLVAERLSKGNIPSSWSVSGSVYGEQLFPLTEGANLRVLDDNIWDYSPETLPKAWEGLPIDCRDEFRWRGFAQLVIAYMPDVITLQEYNVHMHKYLYPELQKYGYKMCYVPSADEPWAHTPVFYREESVSMVSVNYNLYTPKRWSNIGSKSFVSAVLVHKASGKKFAVVSTHLWYMGENRQPGSDYARAAQLRLIQAEAEVIRSEHNCPILLCGDMNCYEDSIGMQQMLSGGFMPCYRIATVATDNHNGHHICGPKDGYSRKSRRRADNRPEGAIDHCLLYNRGETEVLVFKCEMAAFTVPLTDHYPNVIDIRL